MVLCLILVIGLLICCRLKLGSLKLDNSRWQPFLLICLRPYSYNLYEYIDDINIYTNCLELEQDFFLFFFFIIANGWGDVFLLQRKLLLLQLLYDWMADACIFFHPWRNL